MADPSRDPLEELLRAEMEQLRAEALQDPQRVSGSRVDALAQLAKLVEIRKSLEAPPPVSPWRRWAAPLVLVATLLVATVLLFTHVGRTEIELDVRVSEVGLRPGADTVLIEGADLRSLGVSGAQEISVRHSADWRGIDLAASEGGALSIEIASVTDAPSSSISLSSIRGDAGMRVWIQPAKSPRQVRLSIESDDLEIQASLSGPIRFAGSGLEPKTVEFMLPRPAFVRGRKMALSLDLTASDAGAIRFAPQIAVAGISLYHVRHFDDRDRRASSVMSGSLFLPALNGSEEKLRAGQELRLDDLQGEIRTIELSAGSLGLQLHGSVGHMETGSYENPRNLMPAWLEWLRARHGVSLLWGTALYVFGLVTAALKWFGRSQTTL